MSSQNFAEFCGETKLVVPMCGQVLRSIAASCLWVYAVGCGGRTGKRIQREDGEKDAEVAVDVGPFASSWMQAAKAAVSRFMRIGLQS